MGDSLGFFDTGQRKWNYPLDLIDFSKDDLRGVKIVREICFFHAEQRGVTILKLKKFFTNEAISLLEHDGYIEVESIEEDSKKEINKSKKSKKK